MYLQALETYCTKFPEVESKKEFLDQLTIEDEGKLEIFLIYTYWFFNEYHTHSMHAYGSKYDDEGYESLNNIVSIDSMWEEIVFHTDFYYTFRKYVDHFKNKSYKEFEEYSSIKGITLTEMMGQISSKYNDL